MPVSEFRGFQSLGLEGIVSKDGTTTFTPEPVYIAGRPATCANYGTTTPTTGTIIAIPFFAGQDLKVSGLYMYLTSVGGAACEAFIGIYANDNQTPRLHPGTHMGPLETPFTTGIAVDAGAPAVIGSALTTPILLTQGGIYWTVYTDTSSTLAVAAPTFRGIAAQGGPPFMHVANATWTAPYSHITGAYVHTDTALPDAFPITAAQSNGAYPLIGMTFTT